MNFSTLRVGDELLSFTSFIQIGTQFVFEEEIGTQLNKICCSSLILFFTKHTLCHVWGKNQT